MTWSENRKLKEVGQSHYEDVGQSHTGNIGNPKFMAPEVANFEKYSTKADINIFSLGMIYNNYLILIVMKTGLIENYIKVIIELINIFCILYFWKYQ